MDIVILLSMLFILYFFSFRIKKISKAIDISNNEKRKKLKMYIIIMLVICVISVIVSIIFKLLYVNSNKEFEQIIFIFALLNSLGYLGNISYAVAEYRKENNE